MIHSIELTVRGFHCDMFAHVNNARYLEFLEDARWDWILSNGSLAYFKERGLHFIVVSITIHYRFPAVLNDRLQVTIEQPRSGNSSATVVQKVWRTSDQKLIAEAEVTFVLVNAQTGKPVALDDDMQQRLLK